MPRLRDILPTMQQQRIRRIAVPAGTADLLVPSLRTIRHVQMRDEPHIRSIDPHAKGDRRHDHDRFAGAEPGQRRAFVLGSSSAWNATAGHPLSHSRAVTRSVLAREPQ